MGHLSSVDWRHGDIDRLGRAAIVGDRNGRRLAQSASCDPCIRPAVVVYATSSLDLHRWRRGDQRYCPLPGALVMWSGAVTRSAPPYRIVLDRAMPRAVAYPPAAGPVVGDLSGVGTSQTKRKAVGRRIRGGL